MKIIIYLSLIYLSMGFCLHTTDSENQRSDENLITSDHHSKEDREYDAFEREARRKFEQRKTTDAYKRIPAIRRVVPGEDEHDRNEHRRTNSEKRLHHDDDADLDRSTLPDNESDDHTDYQPEEYPRLPNRPSSAPPVVIFGPQPVGRRQIRYRRPSYSRIYDVAPLPVSYRTINPVAYSVPSRVRNVLLGYPPLHSQIRYAGFDDGVAPVEYRGFIAEEYDDFLKKK